MAHNIARLPLVTAILLFTGPAALAQTEYSPPEQAQTTTTQPVQWDRPAGFRMECGQELQRFCNGVQPGEGRLVQCLSSHRSELSSECISRLTVRPGRGVRMDCGQDLQRFCNGVQPGEGRLIQCLSSHRSELSSACTARVAAARPVVGQAPPSENEQSPGQLSAGLPTGHGTASTGAPTPANGPTSTPPAAKGAVDPGAPPATNGSPTTSAPPPAKIPPAKDALAIPL
jgi:hypothetical protein